MGMKSRLHEFKVGIGPAAKELKFMLTRIKQSPMSLVGASIIIFFAAIAILAPVLAPPNPEWSQTPTADPMIIPRESYESTPVPPNAKHPFGTTQQNYDIYYGMVWGTMSAFRIGLWVTLASLIIGVSIGMIAAYYGGIIDEIMMRLTDVIFAFPGLILAMAFVTAFGQSLDNVLLALVLVGWPGYTRLMRGEMLRIKQEDYVEAAKAVGCSDFRVIVRHILPNAMYPILIVATLDIGTIVLAAAGLSFLGLGAPESYADWGQIISRSRNWIGVAGNAYWYTFMIPGLFIFVFVLGWNLLGDALRDIMDPMIRRR